VISDINLGGTSGIELIPRVFESSPDTVVMMISGNRTIDNAIEALRLGAFDYIKKPFDLEHIEIAIRRALRHHSLLEEKRRYENDLEELVRERTEQLNYLAYYDKLTDLPNRSLFEDRFSQALILAGKESHTGLLLLALDRFKEIQDTLGYSSAKQILKEVARRFKQSVGEGVTVAKFEADEFAFLLTNINGTGDVIEITKNINEVLKQPIVIKENKLYLTLSIGISLFPNDGKDIQTLLKNAGIALSRAKEQVGGNYQFYTADMNVKAAKRLTLEISLRRALEREEFEIFYQAKVAIGTKYIVGMEALIRWE
jgi:diguanylate cyclase (GGDEF)-like protein